MVTKYYISVLNPLEPKSPVLNWWGLFWLKEITDTASTTLRVGLAVRLNAQSRASLCAIKPNKIKPKKRLLTPLLHRMLTVALLNVEGSEGGGSRILMQVCVLCVYDVWLSYHCIYLDIGSVWSVCVCVCYFFVIVFLSFFSVFLIVFSFILWMNRIFLCIKLMKVYSFSLFSSFNLYLYCFS